MLFPFIAYPLLAQTIPEQRLVHAYTLERENKLSPAIAELQELLDSKSLNPLIAGQAWNILGLAFEDQGDFPLSQHAYEQSIRILEGLPNNTRDYAMVLDDFGGLYVSISQFKIADGLRVKALHLYEEVQDHAGITRASIDLAGTVFSQKKIHEGRKYLERAVKEARLANDLEDDDHAAIASMRGWLAHFDSDPVASISNYQQALNLWRKSHGEEHPFTGWGYALLGEAHAEAGEFTTALTEMKQGIAILGRTLGGQNPRYLVAEITYSRVLDETGAHTEAKLIKTNAERQLKEFDSRQCTNCIISAAAFQ